MFFLHSDKPQEEINQKFGALESTQNEIIKQITTLFKANLSLKQQNNDLKQTLNAYKSECNDLHKILEQTHSQLITVEQRLFNLEHTSNDGALIWRINHFKEKHAEAMTGSHTSLYSPTFYTNRLHGYRCCAKLYLNGDGKGLRTHLSIFFVILKGDNDALAAWPFRHTVTFSLLNQMDNARDFRDTFRPDPTSSSFNRPKGDANVASGLPLFFSLSQLVNESEGFLKDNSLFLKIQVNQE